MPINNDPTNPADDPFTTDGLPLRKGVGLVSCAATLGAFVGVCGAVVALAFGFRSEWIDPTTLLIASFFAMVSFGFATAHFWRN